MAKDLILLTDVDGLGIVGDLVKVADGFARNYLVPLKKAVPASEKVKLRLVEARANRQAEIVQERDHANVRAEKIGSSKLTLTVRTSGEGRLYGSVGVSEILKAAEDAKIGVTREQIHMGAPIRQLGTYEVRIRLHRDVAVQLPIEVVAEVEE